MSAPLSGPGRIAKAFVVARRRADALDRFAGQVPASIVDAYRVQDLAIGFSGRQVRGCKAASNTKS
jgi:2-keto-4-pentenoate hydratase